MRLGFFWDQAVESAKQQDISVSEMLGRLRGMGYTMADMDFEELRKDPTIPAQLKAADMGISLIYCFFDFVHGIQDDVANALVDAAVRYNAGCIMPIPGFYSSDDAMKCSEEWTAMRTGMQNLCLLAKQRGVTVTIEDFDDAASPIRDSAGMLRMTEAVSDLYITYDTGNFRYTGEDELTAFNALAANIRHVHLKDRSLNPDNGLVQRCMDGTDVYPSAVGEGIVPMEAIFDRLKGIQYDGVLTVEMSNRADYAVMFERSAAFVRRHFSID